MRRNSVTPLASPEPTKKPRINSFEEHVASASAALPNCLPPEVPAQLPGQVRDPPFPSWPSCLLSGWGDAPGCYHSLRPTPACGWGREEHEIAFEVYNILEV